MTEFQLLVLILSLLYLSECVFWVRRGSVVFRVFFGRGFGAAHPSPGVGSSGPGVVALNPLPPFGEGFVCHQWPLSMTAEAVCAFVPNVINGSERGVQSGHLVRFADIEKIENDGATLVVNGHVFARLNSELLALHFVGLLRKLRAMPQGARGAGIDVVLGASLNPRRVRQRLRRYRRASAGLWMYTHGLFFVLFFLVTTTIGIMAMRPWLLSSLGMLVVLLVFTAMRFFEAHRRLFPGAGGLRWRSTMTMFFTPTIAIRARDGLSRDLLTAFQPAAAAMVLCGEGERREFLRRVLLDMEHPMLQGGGPEDAEGRRTVEGFQARLKGALHGMLFAAGEDARALTGAPERDDAGCVSYCPRCDAQFVVAEGVCDRCGDMGLVRFAG